MVFREVLQSYSIPLRNAGSLHILVIPLHRWRFSFFLMISSYHNGEHKPLGVRVVHQNREDEKKSKVG
jgi:hypothetical protein